MLKVQEFLIGGGSLEQLKTELGIEAVVHPDDGRVILNYSQIDSPKMNPIVRECRGVVLDRNDNWRLVARSFPRFFNWGECVEEMKEFDFSDFTVQTKEDGSLIILYFYQGSWRINTRASFGDGQVSRLSPHTWTSLVLEALGINSLGEVDNDRRDVTYVFELVSPLNKVVRQYHEPEIYFLTAFCGEDEIPREHSSFVMTGVVGVADPKRHHFKSIEEIQAFLDQQANADPSFEGVVIRDRANRRWKVKSATYLALHQMFGNGDINDPKLLLPFVLKNEGDELLTYYPEAAEAYTACKSKVVEAFLELAALWEATKHIPVQRDFALAVKDKPFSGILFNMRKRGLTDLAAEWRNSENLILKILFKEADL